MLGIGLGLTSLPVTFVGEAPEFDPSRVTSADLMRAWDFSSDTPTEGAYGTTTPLTLFSGGTLPTISANEVNGRSIALCAGAAKGWEFADLVIPISTDFDIFVAAGDLLATSSATAKALVGKDANNAAQFRVWRGSTNAGAIIRLSGVSYTITASVPWPPGFHVFRLSLRGTTASVYVDGVLIGTATVSAAASTWDAVGWNQSGNFWPGGFGEALLYQGTMSSDDASSNEAYLAARWRSKIFIDFDSGADLAYGGWNEARAFKTFEGSVNVFYMRNGDVFGAKRGTVHLNDGIEFVALEKIGTADKPIRHEAWGDPEEANPTISAYTVVTGWSLVSGTRYKATVALTFTTGDSANLGVVYVIDGADEYRLWSSESTALDEVLINGQTNRLWFYDGTDLYIDIGKDPSACTIRVSHTGAIVGGTQDAAIRSSSDFCYFDDIDINLWPNNGVRVSGSSNRYGGSTVGAEYTDPVTGRLMFAGATRVRNVAGDAFNVGGGSGVRHLVRNSIHEDPGLRPGRDGSQGDTLTGHGSDFDPDHVWCYGATKGGISNLAETDVTATDCRFVDCYRPVQVAAESGGGSVVMDNCYVERPAWGVDNAVDIDSEIDPDFNLTITDTEFVGLGTVRGKAVSRGGSTATLSGNTETGFATPSANAP